MANILNRGMFSMQTSVVGMTRGSTNAAKLDKSKAQNFPSGGVGARSSAVRRAISARTKSSLCKEAIPATPKDPVELAFTAAMTAISEVILAYAALDEVTEQTSDAQQFASDAVMFATAAETYSQSAANAPTTAAARYDFYKNTLDNYLLVLAKAEAAAAAYQDVVNNTTNISNLVANAKSEAATATALANTALAALDNV